MQQKSSGGMTTKRLIAMIALAVLAVAVIVFAVREIRLYGDVQVEQSRTPTPVPGYGNVMQVTIDPSLDGIVGEDTRELLYSDSAQPYATPTPAPTQAAQVTEAPAADDMILLTAESENAIPVGFTADGLPLLVNRDSPLPDDYQPQQLVNMRDYCDSSIVSIKGSEIEGEQIAVDALLAMLMQAQSEGLTSWQISAGYRSVAYQQKLFDDKVYSYRQQGMTGAQARSAARKLVAEPGCSEHHTGLAFDITVPGTSFGGTKQAKWLEEHCWEWGFILRYPADKTAITGITNEPWHFRYVGTDAAMEMRETGECLEEYVERKQSE